MKGIRTIFNKELKRVFKDPKMIFSLFILPVILMVGIYSIIGYLGKSQMEQTQEHISKIYVQNAPEDFQTSLQETLESSDVSYIATGDSLEEIKQGIYSGDVDLLLVFPEDFSQRIENYKESDNAPEIQTFYNPSENYSSHARDKFVAALTGDYQKGLLANRLGDLSILNVFTIDSTNQDSVIQDSAKASGQFLGMMLPYLITILLFAGTMSLGTDAISGEKERGTMASMLVTPISRRDIVLGKMLSLTVLSILSALVYVIALVIALPQSFSGISDTGAGGMQVSLGASQIAMIAVIILTLAFLYVALVAVVAVFAKTVKEATSYTMPLYMVVLVAGLFTMMGTNEGRPEYMYLIPIYNCSVALSEIFTNELTLVHFIMTFGVSLLLGGVITFVIAKAFDDERIMFNA